LTKESLTVGTAILRRIVEIIAALVLLSGGAVLQVIGSRQVADPTTLLIIGGILVAAGGVAISWVASSILAERQTNEAREGARAEVDEKLDNLSRALGQAAGQISQTVEQVELGQLQALTGFALVSQATRTIYGQVNEIAVIRGQKFDAAQLLDTAARLDDLARQLAVPTVKDDELQKTRKELQDIQESLSNVTPQRQYSEVRVACPYCGFANEVKLGSLPGDTAARPCASCELSFNVHRAADGGTIVRRHGSAVVAIGGVAGSGTEPVPRWSFSCPKCARPLSAARDGKGARDMVCPSCISILTVDPDARTVRRDDTYVLEKATAFTRSGTRPKFTCPKCGRVLKSVIITDSGFVGLCTDDKIALTLTAPAFTEYLREQGQQQS
jgi:transcription elongation factor Elf1